MQNDLLSVPSQKQECVRVVCREGGWGVISFSNNFEMFQLDVNAPELPDETSVWLLSPSGRPPRSARLNLHLLSNLLKNVPERKKADNLLG